LTPTFVQLPHTMPFVEVVVGMRDALRAILNHSFSPHLASTGLHCLVADVPLALRNHIFVPASFGERGVDEYQELDETAAHWTNVETLQNHCKVYGLAQEGAITELQERIQRSMDNLLVTADIDWRFPSNEATAMVPLLQPGAELGARCTGTGRWHHDAWNWAHLTPSGILCRGRILFEGLEPPIPDAWRTSQW
jgi:hypothetical protein